MSIQVLVAAINQRDHSLLKKMHIESDVIVANQCDYNSVEKFEYDSFRAIYLNFDEKGVGLNRNNALMRATGEICLFADDDMVYIKNYTKIIKDAFLQYPNADIIVFNLKEKNPNRYIIEKPHRVGYMNYLRYGTARIAIKLRSVRTAGIYFNQCFGGGTEHCHGEDNIFLSDCLKAGLKIYALPITIAELSEERESTWNTGYTKKYLHDQGVLYKTISRRWWKLLCLQDAIRHRREYRDYGNWLKVYMIMAKGQKNKRI